MATATLPKSNAGSFRRDRAYDYYFFPAMVLLILATVFVGFARTYFLAGVFRAPLPNLLIHIHAVVFTIWMLLLIAQTTLVSAGRVDIHRKLGLLGFGLACTMVVLGELAARDMLARNYAPPRFAPGPLTFYAIPCFGILIFAVLIYFAYRERSNPSAHKRLILLANISILDAPTGRPPFTVITAHPFMDSVFILAFLLLLVTYDLWSLHKVHRATLWGSLFVLIAGQLRVPIGLTHPWLAFAAWMQHLGR
jgi:hypothetical protein